MEPGELSQLLPQTADDFIVRASFARRRPSSHGRLPIFIIATNEFLS
jgi:hypothetical protein